ncbi:MAG: hypothetical protein J7J96_04915 [Sulfurimonas sp.]|nr:hypothetical protein [Sulfurimonas sp.]
MQKTILLLLTISTALLAELSETIHSSFSTYYESKSFSNSVQKEDATVYGIGADIHLNNSTYKITYEKASTNTKQPPLTKDLHIDKLFLKYGYKLNKDFMININYINIMNDNIALTDEGKSYGVGLTYHANKKLTTNFTQFYSNYEDFSVHQSDLRVDFKTKINDIKMKITSITKYINIDEKNKTTWTKNAKDHYLTTGLKIHSHYKSYHLGAGVFFGKRVFAIMNDGFKIQHHAMEFDRTYAIGIGKSINNFVFRTQYIYQRATELPMLNENVKVKVLRLIANYKF